MENFNSDLNAHMQLEEEGYIRLIRTKNKTPILFVFTNKSKPYVTGNLAPVKSHERGGKIKLAEFDSIEITGIREVSETEQKVEFIVKYTPTPFGNYLLSNKSLIKNKVATFVFYDDGWRLRK